MHFVTERFYSFGLMFIIQIKLKLKFAISTSTCTKQIECLSFKIIVETTINT